MFADSATQLFKSKSGSSTLSQSSLRCFTPGQFCVVLKKMICSDSVSVWLLGRVVFTLHYSKAAQSNTQSQGLVYVLTSLPHKFWLHFVPEVNPAYHSSLLSNPNPNPALSPQQKPSGGVRRDHAAASKLQQHSEQQPPRHVPLEPLRRGQLLQADGGGAARPRVRHAQSKCVKTLAVVLDHHH